MFSSAPSLRSPATGDGPEKKTGKLAFLLGRRAPSAPPGRCLYAIGDVHGRADLLDALLNKIAAAARRGEQATLIFLGDYVDRGPQSRQVIDRVLRLRDHEHDVRFLRGNHEAALLDFLINPEGGRTWMALGGAETLYSYGVSPPGRGASAEEMKAASRAFNAALPPSHFEFLQRLETFIRLGDYLFVHAGLRPGRSLDEQSEDDMLEIRDTFLKSKARWPYVVVHGHSPVSEAKSAGGRIALDTGAYATGKLSAVRLEGEQVSFINT
ncbi:MAG: metallophosphoesterase family protein [Alphaproteobacteria bacterium]